MSSLFTQEFSAAAPRDLAKGDPLWVTLELTPRLLDELGSGGAVFAEKVRARARHAATKFASLRARSCLGPLRGRFSLVPGCNALLQERTDKVPEMTVHGLVTMNSVDEIESRLRDDLMEAADQLRAAPGGRAHR